MYRPSRSRYDAVRLVSSDYMASTGTAAYDAIVGLGKKCNSATFDTLQLVLLPNKCELYGSSRPLAAYVVKCDERF